jgi:hypothetical protein
LRQATKRRSEGLPKSYFPKPGTDCERDDRSQGRSRAARRSQRQLLADSVAKLLKCHQFPAKRANGPQSPIDVASRLLPKSPVSSQVDNVVPQLLFDRRVHGPENVYSVTQKDFCNSIGAKRTFAKHRLLSAITGSQLIYRSLRRRSSTKHFGFMSKRPVRFSSSSSRNITPIVNDRIFSVCFWIDGREQT